MTRSDFLHHYIFITVLTGDQPVSESHTLIERQPLPEPIELGDDHEGDYCYGFRLL